MAKIVILPPETIHSLLNLTVMQEVQPAAQGSENATQEQGYLMAYDKREQKAKGVKGIAANGELETLEANEQNKGQFIRVDRFGNFFTNFGKNFLYQYNNPTRFSLYRMEESCPVEQAAKKIEDAQQPQNESLRRELSKNNRIYNNHFFNEREIQLGAGRCVTGLPRTCSRQTGDMEKLLQGRQSGIAYDISMNTELGRQKGDAKLSLFRDEDGAVKFDLHFIRQAPGKSGRNTGVTNWRKTCLEALNLYRQRGQARQPGHGLPHQGDEALLPLQRPDNQRDVLLPGRPGPPPAQDKGLCAERQGVCRLRRRKEVPIEFKSSNGKVYQTSIQMSAAERGTEFLWERSTKKPEKRQVQEQAAGLKEAAGKPARRTRQSVTPKM